MRRVTFVLTAAMLAITTACASSPGASTQAPRSDRNRITEAEILPEYGSDAFELIRRLRPHFFHQRGEGSINHQGAAVQVYVNGAHFGGPESLRQLGIESLKEVRFLDARDATTRYGTGHTHGAILITTK